MTSSRADWTGRDLDRVWSSFPGLDPDVPLRYRPVLERLGETRVILEIGRGEVGLSHLLGRPLVSCDVTRPARRAAGEEFVLATGTRLPFRAKSFDAVVAVDVLEHVPAPSRALLVREALRISRDLVFFAGPCAGSGTAERRLRRLLRGLRGRENPWLEEHAAAGLPSERDVRGAIPAGWVVEVVPNVNLKVWMANRVLADAFGVRARAFAALGGIVDFGTTYRTVFVVRRRPQG